MEKMNLQKFIALSGVCSRRAAETLIRAGRITLNQKRAIVTDRVAPDDVVRMDGKAISPPVTHLTIAFNKPEGYVCTRAQFTTEKNIFLLLPKTERLFSVGRLDKYSSGLLILTTDGDLAQKLTHPKFEHEKEYQVVTTNAVTEKQLAQLRRGVDIAEGDGVVRPQSLLKKNEYTTTVVLTQGKKRQIRRMFAAVGLSIQSLERTRIGKLTLGTIAKGEFRELQPPEINLLLTHPPIQSRSAR